MLLIVRISQSVENIAGKDDGFHAQRAQIAKQFKELLDLVNTDAVQITDVSLPPFEISVLTACRV